MVVNKIRRKEGKGTCHLQSEIIFPPSKKCIKHFKEIQFTIQGLDIALSVVSEWNSVWRTNSIACPDSLKCLVSESNFELQWNLWWKDLQTKGGIQRRGGKQDILYWLNVGTLKFGFFEEQFQQVGLFWSEDTTLTKTKFPSSYLIFKNIQFSNIRLHYFNDWMMLEAFPQSVPLVSWCGELSCVPTDKIAWCQSRALIGEELESIIKLCSSSSLTSPPALPRCCPSSQFT